MSEYKQLVNAVRRRQAELDFELSRCDNIYRLEVLLSLFVTSISNFHSDAQELLEELEMRS